MVELADLAGAHRDHVRAARRGHRQGPLRRGRPDDDRVGPAGRERAGARPWWPGPRCAGALVRTGWSCSRSAPPSGLMNWAIYQAFARIPLGHRGHHRVRRPAHAGGARLPPRPRPRVGGAGAAAACSCSASNAPSSTVRRGAFRAARGRCVGVVHPAERADRAAVAGFRRPDHGQRHRHGARWCRCSSRRAARRSLGDHRILLLGALVGLLSSVIPYTCELVALRSLRPSVFSVLMSLEPAAAALAGTGRCCTSCSARCSCWPWPASSWPASEPPGAARPSRNRCQTEGELGVGCEFTKMSRPGVVHKRSLGV